jgi:hypothetical protein
MWIESIPSNSVSLKSILILSLHKHLGLQSGLLYSGCTTTILYSFLIFPSMLLAPSIWSSSI